MHNPITEEFDDPQGRFLYYDTSDVDALEALNLRRHVNLRTFSNATDLIPRTVYTISLPMETINEYSMSDLAGSVPFISETWTSGTYGPDAALGNRNSLRLTAPVVTESIGTAFDLSGWNSTDELSLALPGFPATVTNAWIELQQGTQVVRLNFPAGSGDREVKWPISDLGAVLKPDTVRFSFGGTGTVKIAAIRVLSPDWTPTTLDTNTITGRLEPTVARTGVIPTAPFPKLWRASDPPGEEDPKPVNSKLALNFNTGSMTGANRVTFFLRGRREDFLTQLDLNGQMAGPTLTHGTTQGILNEYGRQPDYGRAMYNPVPQEDYNALRQSQLDTYTQAELERAPDYISEAWVEVTFRFGTTNELYIATTESSDEEEITLPVDGLTPNTSYLLLSDLVDSRLHVRIFALDAFGQFDRDAPLFDSHEISNDFLLKRRKGRIGWEVVLEDGDSYINSIRSRGLMFGEFITQGFESLTPVEGARIFAGATPPRTIHAATVPFNGSTVSIDMFNTRSKDGSAQITADAGTGVQTEFIIFEDFEQVEIEFDLFYPSKSIVQDPYDSTRPHYQFGAYLLSNRNLFVPIQLPSPIGDQWQHIKLTPHRAFLEQSGSYKFVLLQESGSATFWVDNLEVKQRTVAWSGRASLFDPWNRGRNAWTEFRSLVNNEIDGVVFPERGRYLQIRGQALTQEAHIDRMYAKPKYAELGRLVWDFGRKYSS